MSEPIERAARAPSTGAMSLSLAWHDFPDVRWEQIKDALLPETREAIFSLARMLDLFAEERIEALLDPSEEAIEAAARAICRSWLKPRADQEPEFTNQRWPLFKNDALSGIRAYHMKVLGRE